MLCSDINSFQGCTNLVINKQNSAKNILLQPPSQNTLHVFCQRRALTIHCGWIQMFVCWPGDNEPRTFVQDGRENRGGFLLGPVGQAHAKTLLSHIQGNAYKLAFKFGNRYTRTCLINAKCTACLLQEKFLLRSVQFYPSYNCETVVCYLCVLYFNTCHSLCSVFVVYAFTLK